MKVKNECPSYSFGEVAKELGKRWADMAPVVKQRYQQMAEEGRQKYDQDMATYNHQQGNGGGEIFNSSVGVDVIQKNDFLVQSRTGSTLLDLEKHVLF